MAKITILFFLAVICNGLAVRMIEVDGVKTVIAQENEEVTTESKADNDMACLWDDPSGKLFSAIGMRYSFPPNKSLDRGDCAVSIRKVVNEDVGRWTYSAAGLDDGQEQLDKIFLQVKGHTLSEGSAIAFGAIGIFVVLVILGLGYTYV